MKNSINPRTLNPSPRPGLAPGPLSALATLALLAALALVHPASVLGDGGFVAPRGSFMFEPTQQAFIDYDSNTQTEQLSILPSFYGDANAFAWIVPVPGLPEVAQADKQLFRDLDNLTRPVYRSRDGDWDCFQRRDFPGPDFDGGGVEIIDSRLVGYYQTMTLAATEAPALLDSLTTWGFLHPENQEIIADAIADYVDRSWYFVTFQIDSTALDEINSHGYYGYDGYVHGGLDPIQLTFASEEIIYPMKISAISAANDSQVHIYVNTDHRMTFPGANTHYANRFSSGELKEISHFPSLRTVLQPGDFLTKLHRGYRPEQMTEDIVLQRASSDDEFQLIHYSGFPWTGVLLLAPPLVLAVKRRFWIGEG